MWGGKKAHLGLVGPTVSGWDRKRVSHAVENSPQLMNPTITNRLSRFHRIIGGIWFPTVVVQKMVGFDVCSSFFGRFVD